MELKDAILQTIHDFDQDLPQEEIFPTKHSQEYQEIQKSEILIDSRFLELLREKTLVLFEGLQSSQTKDLSNKLDLVLNYLEYQLSLIDEALEK